MIAIVLKMSMGSQKTTSQAIPTTRRVTINDAAHMPHDYSTTPGGTLFSTTPGGKCHELVDESVWGHSQLSQCMHCFLFWPRHSNASPLVLSLCLTDRGARAHNTPACLSCIVCLLTVHVQGHKFRNVIFTTRRTLFYWLDSTAVLIYLFC